MKSKFGTALALVAVLLTGTAAAAINTQALISPTESTLGTAATTLLPPIDMVAVGTPEPTPGAAVPTSSNGTTVGQPDAGSIYPAPTTGNPETTTPVPSGTQPTATANTSTASPKVIYGNPNPSTGDDEDEDEDEDDDEDEDEDDD